MNATLANGSLAEMRAVDKGFGTVIALQDVSFSIFPGEVRCVLGDNGAGKSTLIKILSGVFRPDGGQYLLDGIPIALDSPREALDLGIATVYQDLGMIPLMAVWRNFVLGNEPKRGRGPLRRFDVDQARSETMRALASMGIDVRDVNQAVGTLSGGERQSIAIARAVHYGARMLILDEPTSALGVRQAGNVLKHIAAARDKGTAVIFISHNPHHAYVIGDRFLILRRGRAVADVAKAETTKDDLMQLMAGGSDLRDLEHEFETGDGA